MIAAWVVDHRARGDAQAAFDRLQKELGDEKHLATVSRDEVHKLVGRDPVDDGNPDDVDEQFSWQGVPYKHSVYVMYTKGSRPPAERHFAQPEDPPTDGPFPGRPLRRRRQFTAVQRRPPTSPPANPRFRIPRWVLRSNVKLTKNVFRSLPLP